MDEDERKRLIKEILAAAEKRVAEWKEQGRTREELLAEFAIILGISDPQDDASSKED